MLAFYLWIFTLIITLAWWLFIVVKIHAYKFKNFSNNITRITNLLLLFLILLTLTWYIAIIFSFSNTQVTVSDYSWFDTKEVNY